MMHFKKITLAIWVATGCAAAHADTLLSPVTISASPIDAHQAIDVPSQIDSLVGTAKAVKDSGSLGEMLEAIPGVNNISSGPQSGKPVVRGLTGERVKVLSNGQATDYQAYDAHHNPNTESFLAESVEVIRGPQSVLYGSEAMGGVVNVVQAPIPYGEAMKGQLASEYNSNNQETMLGAKMGVGAEHFGLTAGIVERRGDNFHVPKVTSALGVTPSSPIGDAPLLVGEVPNTHFENQAATLGVGYQADWGQIELRHTQWQALQNALGAEAADETSPYEALASGQKLHNAETQLKTEFYLGDDWVLKPSWTHTQNQREESEDVAYEAMASAEDSHEYLDLRLVRDDVKLALEHPQIGDFKGEVGVDFTEKQQTLHSGHLAPSADESKRALYLFEEANYDQWLVQFGTRYDWQAVQVPLDGNNQHFVDLGLFDASNNSRDFEVLSSSLGATYHLNNHWSVAGNIAQGFRAPSIFELYAGGEHGGVQAFQIGNPELEAETALNTDLSLRWKTPKTQMVATVYQNWIDNYIYIANTGFYRASEGAPNEGERVDASAPGAIIEMQTQQTDGLIRGFELSVEHQWNPAWSNDLALEIIEGIDTRNQQDLVLMPANNLRVSQHYHPQDRWKLREQRWSLGVKLVDSKKTAGAYEPFSQFDTLPFGTASTPSYALWHLRYQGVVKLDKQSLLLGAAVENLLDNAYVDFLDTYKGYTLAQGRNFKLTARLDF